MSTLGSVNVGDYIAWTAPNGCVCIAKVKRLTMTRVITEGQAWRISDGRRVGSLGWPYDWARPATDDDVIKADEFIKSLEAQE